MTFRIVSFLLGALTVVVAEGLILFGMWLNRN